MSSFAVWVAHGWPSVQAQAKVKSTSGWEEWVVRSDGQQGFVSRALLTSISLKDPDFCLATS
jgi:hypothetical protein